MTRVLVTGASGFVGSHVLRWLSADPSLELHAAVRRPAALTGAIGHSFDAFDTAAAEGLLSSVRANVLVHCAWTVEHGKFWTAPSNRQWVDASLALVKRFVALGGHRVVVLGTMAEYDWNAPQPMSEVGTPERPATYYGQCKLSLLRRLTALAEEQTVSLAWARLFNLFGEREDPRRFVPYVVRTLLAGEVAACTHGRQVRDYLDVREVGRAIAALATSQTTGPVNVASGEPVTQAEVAMRIGEIIGRPELVALDKVPAPLDDPPTLVASVQRLRAEVGFVPDHDLRRDLARTVEYWRSRAVA